MGRLSSAVMFIVLTVTGGVTGADGPVSISSDGWTVSADPGRQTFGVTHAGLGAVLNDVRLYLQDGRRLSPLGNWTIERQSSRTLVVRTAEPLTAWQFELGPNALKVSCTSFAGLVRAQAPAPRDRPPARVLDPGGVPVGWVGTNEVSNSYGGSETRVVSFLPNQNPETMVFALGQVAGDNLHNLFDRRSDTVIGFGDRTTFRRNGRDADLLDVTMPVPGNALIRLVPDYYTKTLGVPYYRPYDDTHFPKAPVVWGSWTSVYQDVTEAEIVRNTDWIAANLLPYGFEYVQLDDGYDRGRNGEHYWIEKWDTKKFPRGPKWLAGYIKSKGLRPGLWIVPNTYAGAVEEHPEWYLRDRQGKPILDYNTPALDSTHPQVLEFLRREFTTLREWGFEYFKFDGEHALPLYAPTVDKSRLYDTSVEPLQAYRDRLQVIRETVGPGTFIEGCPAGTPLNGIGFFDSYFTGHDVYNSWQGMYALFSSINANAFLNHLVVYVMPGEGIEVGPLMTVEEAKKRRPPSVLQKVRTREEPLMGFGTTIAEARTLVTYLALTGVVYPIASVLPELPEERVRLLKATLPPLAIVPVDLFSRGTDMQWNKFKETTPDTYIHNYPEILDLKVNSKSGVYDVVGLTNWRSAAARRAISFSNNLGLPASASYVAFDFWNQKLLGVFQGGMQVEIEPHDTRVLLIRPLEDHPQLVGTSRHISGAYSILRSEWDGSAAVWRGSSQTVPGDLYTLWFSAPDGWNFVGVHASAKSGREIPVRHELRETSLMVSFAGQPEPADWEVRFRR